MADPAYPAFSVFSFLGFVLVLIPLPWHFQAWNSGTCLFMIWTAIGSLNLFINSIIWHNNAIDWAPVWCDISTRLTVGLSVAIPAASLCINRRLYKIASCQIATITRAHKRRAVMVDLLIGLGIPVLQMGLQFIVQGHRYNIWEDIGCYPTTVNTPAAYPLSFLWPNVIGLISAIYCIMTLREFMKRRAQFSQFLSSNSSLTVNRYFRLMCLATVELLVNTPISAYGLYLNISTSPIYPWKSWADIHFDWFTIDTFPGILWRSNTIQVVTLELSRWTVVFCAFTFFAFFGFADEARKQYRIIYWGILKRFGVAPPSPTAPKPFTLPRANPASMKDTTSSLPAFIHGSQLPRKSSVSSIGHDSFHGSDYTASVDHHSPALPEYKLNLTYPPTPSTQYSQTSLHNDFKQPTL
ncbi:Pheromone B alpha 3 receptor [Hypsizygus marmoreus]|uniref:Pheromone B alpha 3 receptor n=1 Tax=Hypsizygus marmoreus TaxID=39966 RepID=A0A369JCG4_HYPMA|nr:Pheromone B alpha 3 receptor [Hypsizygus marmoreus]